MAAMATLQLALAVMSEEVQHPHSPHHRHPQLHHLHRGPHPSNAAIIEDLEQVGGEIMKVAAMYSVMPASMLSAEMKHEANLSVQVVDGAAVKKRRRKGGRYREGRERSLFGGEGGVFCFLFFWFFFIIKYQLYPWSIKTP